MATTISSTTTRQQSESPDQRQDDRTLHRAQTVLRSDPGNAQARLIMGRTLRRLGRLEDSLDCLARLQSDLPHEAAPAFEFALTANLAGRRDDALIALERATERDPALVPAWWLLADALRASGRPHHAERATLAGIDASVTDAALVAAGAALARGNLAEAEAVLRPRLRLWPTDVAAIRMMGELAVRLGRLDDAISLLRRALDLAPGFQTARELLARTLSRLNRPLDALAETEILLASAPANISHRMLKASILVVIGEQDEARAIYEALVAEDPHLPRVWLGLGHVYKTIGRRDDAVRAYRAAIADIPEFGEAWWSLANLKTFRFDDEDIGAMSAALTATDNEAHRLHLHFALGKLFEDAGDHAQAFEHYRSGNRIRRAQLPYDANRLDQETRTSAALLTAPFFTARTGWGHPAPDPIFIVGLPRSGSTLVEQILSSHSAIEGTMELPDLIAIARRLRANARGEQAWPDLLGTLRQDELHALGAEYLERTRVHRKQGRALFIDKMPNNWQHVGLIRLILPNARIVDARRHPLACCFSAWKQHFASGQHFSYDLTDVGRYYRSYVDFMAAMDRALPGHVHRVIYEDMVADTEQQVRRLLDHVGLPFEESCLAFWQNPRSVRTASSEQVRQPIFRDGLDQWRHFEPWLGKLKGALGPALHGWR